MTSLVGVEQRLARLRAQAEELPEEAGVYCFLDKSGKTLYAGKARSVRKRVRSYFQRDLEPRLVAMLEAACELECVTTASEEEALLLENQLIKSRRPRYNVLLRDDKAYPYLKLTQEEWPRLLLTRRVIDDGSEYFGPYVPGGGARRAMRLVQRLTGVRVCDLTIDGSLSRPCLYHSLGRCLGPCVANLTNAETYRKATERARAVLSGKSRSVAAELRREMEQAAENLEFERAAVIRDLRGELERIGGGPRWWFGNKVGVNADIFGIAVHGGQVALSVLWIRSGALVERRELFWEGPHAVDPAKVLGELLPQYYAGHLWVPAEIHLPFVVEAEEALSAWLSRRSEHDVRIVHPKRGREGIQLQEAQRDAERAFARRFRSGALSSLAADRLAELLELPEPPRWIEGLDVAHSQGRETVGAVVVWKDGRLAAREHRTFRLDGIPSGDDFAALKQLTLRHYSRVQEEGNGFPDLVLVDGGLGQLHAVLEVLQDLGEEVPTVALAKREELLVLPSKPDPIRLQRSDLGLLLLERIRDEAHRYANARHRRLRSRRGLGSRLTAIRGIGPKRKRQLLQTFGSLDGIRRAGEAELARILGRTLARQVLEALSTGSWDSFPSGVGPARSGCDSRIQ